MNASILFTNDPTATDIRYKNHHDDKDWIIRARCHCEELYLLTSHLLDNKFTEEIKHNFHACYSEMYFAATFIEKLKLELSHPSDEGLDFYVKDLGAWLEVATATDGKLDNVNSLSRREYGKVYERPENKIILRLTNTFLSKAKKIKSDIKKGLVSDKEPVILCLSGGGMSESLPMHEEGGYPEMFKALLPIGNLTYWIDQKTGEITAKNYEYRETTSKFHADCEVKIKTDYFLDDNYSHISAVVYSYADSANHLPREKWGNDFYVIHNPKASNPIDEHILTCGREYRILVSEESFTLQPPIDHRS